MRIGGRSFIDSNVTAMGRMSDAMARLQGQIASGKRFTAASEAPQAAQKAALVNRRQADNARYALGLDQAEQRLGLADSALDGITKQLVRARELALATSNGTTAPADRAISATEMRELLNVMLSLGNIQDASGNHLFAGAKASTPAFAVDAVSGRVVYQGLGEAADIAVGANATIRATEPAPALFGGIDGADPTDVFAIVERFIALLEAPPADPADPAALAAEQLEFDAAITGTAAAVEHLSIVRASFGGRLNRIEAERDRLGAVGDRLTVARSALEDTDFAQTISELSRADLVLRATQQSFAQVGSLSLFDALR